MFSKETKRALNVDGEVLYKRCVEHIPDRVPRNTDLEVQVARVAAQPAGSSATFDSDCLHFYIAASKLANEGLCAMIQKYGQESRALLRGHAELIEHRLRAAAQAVVNHIMAEYDVSIAVSWGPRTSCGPRTQWIAPLIFMVSSIKQDELEAARQKLTEAFAAVESALKKRCV